MPEPSSDDLAAIEKAMQRPEMQHAAELLLAAWRLYWLGRVNMISASNGAITDDNFQVVSNNLAHVATVKFKIGKLKNQLKRIVLPFLRKLSMREARLSEDTNVSRGTSGPGQETCHP